jgi:hypothetical protein
MRYFGEYNHVNVLIEGGRIAGLRDAAHHKETVEFDEEDLLDLAAEQRHPAEFTISEGGPSWAPDPDINFPAGRGRREVEIGGHTFAVAGQERRAVPTGFGRGLSYQLVAGGTADRISVLLTVELPRLVRYRARWPHARRNGSTFEFPQRMSVTVLTDLPWSFSAPAFTVETGDADGAVTFLGHPNRWNLPKSDGA